LQIGSSNVVILLLLSEETGLPPWSSVAEESAAAQW
jgi:hypothetical protein